MAPKKGDVKEKRPRWAGTAEDLCTALLPHVTGRMFIDYQENAEDLAKTQIDEKKIAKLADLLATLHALDPLLAFKKKTTEGAMTLIASRKVEIVKVQGGHVKVWAVTMAQRLRGVCYVIRGAESRSSPPAWVKTLPWHVASQEPSVEAPAQESPDEEDKADDDDDDEDCVKIWDGMQGLAYRSREDGEKEWCLPVQIPPDALMASRVCVTWDDGMTWEVPTCTWEQFSVGAQRGPHHEFLWSGDHKITKHRWTVVQKPDRSNLLALCEQGRQRDQVMCKFFGPLPKWPDGKPTHLDKDSETLKAALEFYIPLCEQLASGDIDLEGLKASKVELMKGKRAFDDPNAVKRVRIKCKEGEAPSAGEGEGEEKKKEGAPPSKAPSTATAPPSKAPPPTATAKPSKAPIPTRQASQVSAAASSAPGIESVPKRVMPGTQSLEDMAVKMQKTAKAEFCQWLV